MLDTFDNFLKAMAPHMRDHVKVSIDDVEMAEKKHLIIMQNFGVMSPRLEKM